MQIQITKLLLLSILLLTIYDVNAQHLKRRGALGLQVEPIPDSIMASKGWGNKKAVMVSRVFNETTCSQLKMKSGDVLFEVNGTPITGLRAMKLVTQHLHVGEKIRMKVASFSDTTIRTLEGNVVARHLESSGIGEVVYDEVPYAGTYVRSIIHKPFGNGKFPAIFFIQGFACTTVELPYETNHPIQQLIDAWVKAGYVVYRMEKPGVGDSDETIDCLKLNYKEELSAFENAIGTLKSYKYIDSTQIFLFGQALGSITAPLLANTTKVKGIITYGAIARPWFESVMESRRQQNIVFGASYEESETDVRKLIPIYYDWLVRGYGIEELLQNTNFSTILTSEENPLQIGNGNTTIYGRNPMFYTDLNRIPILASWEKAKVPVLALHGDCDLQSIDISESQLVVDLANNVKPGNGTLKILKGTEQNFVKVNSKQEYIKTLREGRYTPDFISNNFNKEIIKSTVDWMKLIRTTP